MRPLIAIDGEAGAGKSTVSRALALRLDLDCLDTGAMYRAVTLLVLEHGLDLRDANGAAKLASQMELDFGAGTVALNGKDVTRAIRSAEVDAAVSHVAALTSVRGELVRRQREWASKRDGGVVEGRDIGSVVFPGADLKVYLTADAPERARRRLAPEAEVRRRDTLDSSRPVSPLRVPDGALVVDSTSMSVDEVIEEVLSHL